MALLQGSPAPSRALGPDAEAPRLLPLIGGEALALSGIQLDLLHPVPQGLDRDPEILGHPGDRSAGANQSDGLGPELRRVRRCGLASQRGLLRGAEALKTPRGPRKRVKLM